MFSIFAKGGPLMWPLLVASVVAISVAIDRLWFIYKESRARQPELVENVLRCVEKGDVDAAILAGKEAQDVVAKVLVYGLMHRHDSFSNALLLAANRELKSYSKGLSVLDTIITLAPLLGLLGTVTGMIHAFGLLGGKELGAPTAITGGISEALIATAFGLFIAIVALIPFNYLSKKLEDTQHDLETAATHLELLILKGK